MQFLQSMKREVDPNHEKNVKKLYDRCDKKMGLPVTYLTHNVKDLDMCICQHCPLCTVCKYTDKPLLATSLYIQAFWSIPKDYMYFL